MDETTPRRPHPGPAHAASASGSRISRRWFLAGGLAVLAGGGAGVGADFWRHHRPAPLPRPPAALLAAAAAERALIADLDATTGGPPEVRRVIVAARADHAAHLQALQDLLTSYRAAATRPALPHGTPRTLSQLRAAEQRAAVAAESRASGFAGTRAALFASIAASEASHAELLR